MAQVQITGITKNYGAVAVLKGIELSIEDGSFVVLVGPSGCGKSTLLRMVAGLEEITSGEIHIGARKVNDLPPKDRDIAMVFQNYALYPHMTVQENMAFALKLRNFSPEEIQKRVADAAQILGMGGLLERFPRQLSGGQRQRVAMGRAIVRHPQVFLFDEPLSNLDANLRVQMRAEIKALHQRLKTTSIYVTHDQVEAMTMADTVVVMHDGVIEQKGPPIEVYDDPDTTFVASFIGSPSMNLLRGEVTQATADGAQIRLDDSSSLLSAARSPKSGQQLLAGIRPEQLRLDDHGSLHATVTVTEPTGTSTVAYFQCAGQNLCAVFNERISLKPGQTVRLTADSSKTLCFDAANGKRLR